MLATLPYQTLLSQGPGHWHHGCQRFTVRRTLLRGQRQFGGIPMTYGVARILLAGDADAKVRQEYMANRCYTRP
jgi:hypothetical protein